MAYGAFGHWRDQRLDLRHERRGIHRGPSTARESSMEAFLVSISPVALAEMGDRTQLLALLLATRFPRPWPILAGVFVATLVNHALAGVVGVWIGHRLSPAILDAAVGISLVGMALWMLQPDTLSENDGK